MNDINVILNGNIVKGSSGETIYDLAKRNGIEIPTLCHDPRIEPYTSCYICVVEVEGMRGLQPSCSTKISEGMKIETMNPKVKKARKMALDLLLSNHYADCVAPCKETCPAGVDVQGYISLIEKGLYHDAVALIKETNPLPAICGRVCVRPCEVACRRNLLDEGTGVGIDYLKRFASDIDIDSPDKWRPVIKPATGKKVAVIGAGPGGISAAFFLRKEGHEVDVFEAGPKPGGWLRYGIPEYRLPNDLLQKEFDNIAEMGVGMHYNQRLGDNLKYADLKAKYDATILAIGSQKGTGIGCEGDDAENVLSGVDFLRDMEMTGQRYDFRGKRIAVVGGGNTAMDCCRSSIRCGSTDVVVIYRRTEAEMPANPIEIHESKLEGVRYLFLTNPTKVNKDENGKLKSVTCQRMELGEPDASGRRRPVPVEGSEFDLELDYILAAIGQKTDAAFLADINQHCPEDQQVKVNRWGDLDADKHTLQMGNPSFFAAGDGVTGPATLIQAVGQARVAARSCHQYLMGLPIEIPAKEFISRRDHFKEQQKDDYKGYYEQQSRQEMPTLDPADRLNFNEVELGYQNFQAEEEVKRCLECGCTEYYTCDLKRYGTEYQADQKKIQGEFKEYKVDFRHPYIEIDNNKCILCSRCIRICREIVGANALGLVNRGYDTFVAPSMGTALQDTSCESCGLCISTCPTGAITENVPFKPGPVKLGSAPTVCNYCSVGCEISYEHKNGFVMRVNGRNGQINPLGNLCRFPKFGYHYINRADRLRKPLLKVNGKFEEISFGKAFEILGNEMKKAGKSAAFFAGARLTNEEMYLIQKLARLGVKSPNVGSFHYLGADYAFNSRKNVPFDQIRDASRLILFGSEINKENAVAGFMVQETSYHYGVPVELITNRPSAMEYKIASVRKISSYYHFIKAVNYYLVANDFHNQLYINDNTSGYEAYKASLMKEDFSALVSAAGVKFMDEVIEFAKALNNEMNAVILYSEKELGAATCRELHNLAMLTGKLGKTANGLLSLKEKNNSHGLFDMGCSPEYLPGMQSVSDEKTLNRIAEIWGTTIQPDPAADLEKGLDEGKFSGLFIFGEDPVGCARDKKRVGQWIEKAAFVMVQDYFLTETAAMADLILPASLPAETGGSFSNTQRHIQTFDAVLPSKTDQDSLQQLFALLKQFGSNGLNSPDEVLSEAFRVFSPELQDQRSEFVYTPVEDTHRHFEHGCDYLTLLFQDTLAV